MADMFGYQSAIQGQNRRLESIQEANDLKQANNLTATDDYNKQVAERDVLNDLNYGKDLASNLFSGSAIKGAFDARNARVAKTAENLKKARLGSAGLSDAVSDAYKNQATPSLAGEGGPRRPINLDTSFMSVKPVPRERGGYHPPPPPPSTGSKPSLSTGEDGDKPKPSTLTKFISGASGTDEETAELVGRVGGAVSNATMGGLSIYDDVDNLVKSHGKRLFDKGASASDDVNNITSTIASASDVIGLIPGAEWVAGLGNLIGEAGNITKLFGDHDKDKTNAPLKPPPTPLIKQPINTGSIANVGVQSAVDAQRSSAY